MAYLRATRSSSGAGYLREVIKTDTAGPVITMPGDVTLYIPFGYTGLPQSDETLQAIITGIIATDETYPLNPAVSTDVADLGDPIPVGVHTVTASATDHANNTSTATFTLTVEEEAADTTPSAFDFGRVTGVALNTVVEAGPITVAGVDSGVAIDISIDYGEYAVASDGVTYGAWTSSAGTVQAGYAVKVKHLSSPFHRDEKVSTLVIGGVAGTLTSETISFLDISPIPPGNRLIKIDAESRTIQIYDTGSRVIA